MAARKKELVKQDRQWYVAKSNDLIQRTRYSLPINQQKMLLYMISRIKPQDAPSQVFTFSIPDFCQVAGINLDDSGTYYTALKQQIQQLADSSAWIRTDEGKEALFRWIDTA